MLRDELSDENSRDTFHKYFINIILCFDVKDENINI